MRIEVGLVRDGGVLAPGPNHQTFELCRGINHDVPRDIAVRWIRANGFLNVVKSGGVRLVDADGNTLPDQPRPARLRRVRDHFEAA